MSGRPLRSADLAKLWRQAGASAVRVNFGHGFLVVVREVGAVSLTVYSLSSIAAEECLLSAQEMGFRTSSSPEPVQALGEGGRVFQAVTYGSKRECTATMSRLFMCLGITPPVLTERVEFVKPSGLTMHFTVSLPWRQE